MDDSAVQDFLSEAAVRESRIRARRFGSLVWIMSGAVLIFFVVMCLLTRTGNAKQMAQTAWICLIPMGWAVIAVRQLVAEPARAEERHLKTLSEGETEMHEGRFFLSSDVFRIPKSVRIRKVRLETGEESLSLNLNERLRDRMPADGALVRVWTVHKFIVRMDVQEAGTVQTLRGTPGPGRKILRGIGRILPAAVIWTMMAPILTGFVFSRITDTAPQNKIVIYADCEVRSEEKLAEMLERELAGAIRMVQVHPFSYAMFGTEQLKTADLYIVPDSRKEEYAEWFTPLPGTSEENWIMFDPESGTAAAGEWLLYAPDNRKSETYRLYFGAGSVHREDGLALRAAEILRGMTKTNEEENP